MSSSAGWPRSGHRCEACTRRADGTVLVAHGPGDPLLRPFRRPQRQPRPGDAGRHHSPPLRAPGSALPAVRRPADGWRQYSGPAAWNCPQARWNDWTGRALLEGATNPQGVATVASEILRHAHADGHAVPPVLVFAAMDDKGVDGMLTPPPPTGHWSSPAPARTRPQTPLLAPSARPHPPTAVPDVRRPSVGTAPDCRTHRSRRPM